MRVDLRLSPQREVAHNFGPTRLQAGDGEPSWIRTSDLLIKSSPDRQGGLT